MPNLTTTEPSVAARLDGIEHTLRTLIQQTKDRNMTDLGEVQQLQAAYGSDWIIRVTNGQPCATRRRSLADEELAAGMAMTLYDGDSGTLTELLAKQQRIEDDLVEAGLS